MQFMVPLQNDLSLITAHYYIGNGLNPGFTYQTLFKPNVSAPGVLVLRDLIKNVAPFKLPVRVDEINSFYNSGRVDASNTLAAALWSADVSFQFAAVGASGVNFHGGSTAPYTAIQSRFNKSTREVSVTTQANFYGYVFFQNAVGKATGLLPFIQTHGGKTSIKVWIVGTIVGLVRVAVLNLSKTMASNVTVRLPPGVTRRAGTLVRLVGPSAAAKNMVTFCRANV
jgi:hypothetical protein